MEKQLTVADLKKGDRVKILEIPENSAHYGSEYVESILKDTFTYDEDGDFTGDKIGLLCIVDNAPVQIITA
jgi:DUF917 family protein